MSETPAIDSWNKVSQAHTHTFCDWSAKPKHQAQCWCQGRLRPGKHVRLHCHCTSNLHHRYVYGTTVHGASREHEQEPFRILSLARLSHVDKNAELKSAYETGGARGTRVSGLDANQTLAENEVRFFGNCVAAHARKLGDSRDGPRLAAIASRYDGCHVMPTALCESRASC